MRKIYDYISPIAHLGDTRYSVNYPLLTTVIAVSLLQLFFSYILNNPSQIGLYAIILTAILIVYFSFREGIGGGFITTGVTLLYFFYLIYSLHYGGARFAAGIETTIILGVLYSFLALTIGWLKQSIDKMIEREAGERKLLQAVIDQMPVGVVIIDKKGAIMHQNKKLQQMLGTALPESFQFGKETLPNLRIHGKRPYPTQLTTARSLLSGKPIHQEGLTYERTDGEKIYLEISSAPIRNRYGTRIAAASVIYDVTAQREMEMRKDDFVNMASHELKTPITSMRLYVETLLRDDVKFDARTNRILKSLKTQTLRLQSLVEDMLDVSRIQTGKLQFRQERFRLDNLVREVVQDMHDSSEHVLTLANANPVTVTADKFRIYQVITNLLTNAIKYSEPTKPISVTLKKDGKYALLSVSDHGIGIAKDQQKEIFERLHQAPSAEGKTFPGLGMGLYISREIVRRHRGRIWVESEFGKGSTFFVRLPVA